MSLILDAIHCVQLNKIIQKEGKGKQVVCKDFYLPCPIGSTEDQGIKLMFSNRIVTCKQPCNFLFRIWRESRRYKKLFAVDKIGNDCQRKHQESSGNTWEGNKK